MNPDDKERIANEADPLEKSRIRESVEGGPSRTIGDGAVERDTKHGDFNEMHRRCALEFDAKKSSYVTITADHFVSFPGSA